MLKKSNWIQSRQWGVLAGISLALLTSCSESNNRSHSNNRQQAQSNTGVQEKIFTEAIVYLSPVKGNEVKGKVTFTKVPEGVKIIADIEGLKPGKHGFHVHEFADCGGEGASAAGAHFNPSHHEHGGPDSSSRHVGDLGNLIADENGHAHYERIDKVIQLNGPEAIIGRSIIIHEKEDDYTTQPAGASGSRISCGIVEAVTKS